MSLAERIRESRKITIEVGNIKFFGTRATAEQFSAYSINSTLDAQVARNHVTGWEGVKESDLIEGGSKEIVPFKRADFDEVIGDRPDWAGEIAKAVLSDAIDRINKRAENAKN